MLTTAGLGHRRVLADALVVQQVVHFVTAANSAKRSGAVTGN
jgi:hypothetical protein